MTYSIIARDPDTAQLGVAVQSHYFSVGSVVTWAEAGVGAIATQAMARVEYGPEGLALLRAGLGAQQALEALVARDRGRAVRQVAFVDAAGGVATHTGERCIAEAGHVAGDGWSAQANMMTRDGVPEAMRDAYCAAKGEFAYRLLAALDAAEAAGGDVRGRQSAAMLIVKAERSAAPADGRLLELRVEDNAEPLAEMRRLIDLHRAYRVNGEGDAALGAGDIARATECYREAARLAPVNDELVFWAAVSLYRNGRTDEAGPLFRQCFAANAGLALLVQRLVPLRMVQADDVERILAYRG